MAPIYKKYICVKSLTLSDRSVWDSAYGAPLAVGNDEKNQYTSLLYFSIPPLPEYAAVENAALNIYAVGKNQNGRKVAMAIRPFDDQLYPSEGRQYTDQPYVCEISCRGGWNSIDISELVGRWYQHGNHTLSIELYVQEPLQLPVKIIGRGPLYELSPKIDIVFSAPEKEEVYAPPVECLCHTVDIAQMCREFFFSGETFTPPIDVQRIIQGSFFIDNCMDEDLEATAQVSADGCRWVDDAEVTVKKGNTGVLVAKYYGKYYRLRLHTENAGRAAIRFIMQEHR